MVYLIKIYMAFIPVFYCCTIFAQKERDIYQRTVRENREGFVHKDDHTQTLIPFEYELPDNNKQYNPIGKSIIWNILTENDGNAQLTSQIVEDEYRRDFTVCSLIAVKKNGSYGYINFQNEIEIPFIYQEADNFIPADNRFLAVVSKNGKDGIINLKNETVIPFVYDEIVYVSAGSMRQLKGYVPSALFQVSRDKEYYYIDPEENKYFISVDFEKDVIRLKSK